MPDLEYLTDKNGKAKAVVIPIDLWEALIENLDTESGLKWIDEHESKESILRDFRDSLQQAKKGQTFPVKELWTDLEA